MEVATSTEMKNNFGKYLNMVMNGNEIIVTKNGKPVGRFVPTDRVIEYLTDSLTGIIKGDHDLMDAKTGALYEKYKITD